MPVPVVVGGEHVAVARERAAGDRHRGADAASGCRGRSTAAAGDSVTGAAFSVKAARRRPRAERRRVVGAVMLTVVVCAVLLFERAVVEHPGQIVRVGSEPKLVGFVARSTKVTLSSTCW